LPRSDLDPSIGRRGQPPRDYLHIISAVWRKPVKPLIEVGSVDIDAIKAHYPLADFVGETVALKRKGGSLVGLCPFHDERTPSFTIYESDQHYTCYGCGAWGDLFDFAKHIKGWSIRETAENLNGGIIPTYSSDQIEQIRAKALAAEEVRNARRKEVVLEARRRWDAAVPAIKHDYLTRKGVDAHGTRMESSGLLLVPLIGTDGKVQCLQTISADGQKLFLKDGTVNDGFFILGGKVSETVDTVMIAEGFATAATVQQATGRVTICTYNGGNMVNVAKFFADKYPRKQFQIAGDDDHGKKDNAGVKSAVAAAQAAGCDYILPLRKEGSSATDFNDMAVEYGLEAVTSYIMSGEVPDDAEPPTPEPLPDSVSIRPLAPFDATAIPVRPWVIRGWLLKRQVAMLIAPPGVGKSTITLQQAIAIATGMDWGGWKIERPGKVLLINVEDDIDEMQRRCAAALDAMGLTQADIAGKLFIHDGDREFLIIKSMPNGEVIWSPLVSELTETVIQNDIGVLIVDPFAETLVGEENSNDAMKKAATGFRQVARDGNCAVLLVQHTSKAMSTAAGDMNASRGGSSQTGVVRTAATLFDMGADDAAKFGLPDKDRRFYIRWDDAKSNQSLKSGEPLWFRKVSVDIGNGSGLHGSDSVGAMEPWSPPDAFDNISVDIANQILNELAAGTYKEDRRAIVNGDWAGCPVMRIAEKSEEQAVRILRVWRDNSVLEQFKDKDPNTRQTRNYVRVVEKNRPRL